MLFFARYLGGILHFNNIYIKYKIIRFIFSVFFLFFILFTTNINIKDVTFHNYILLFFVYIITTFLTLFSKKQTILDFILDIVFISALIFLNFDLFKYLALLYIFPIFFASLIIGSKIVFLLAIIIAVLYNYIYYLNDNMSEQNLISLFLFDLSFIIAFFVGYFLHKKFEIQQRYIKLLEQKNEENKVYSKVYKISADLAHELRTPLSSILASIQLMKEGQTSPRLLKIIEKEGEKVESLLKDFLLFSRPKDIKMERVNLNEVLAQIIRKNQKHHINVESYIEGDPIIETNKVAIESVLNNLVKNAFNWAKSKIKITLYAIGDYVYFTIEDDGPGIKEEDKERIFEPFFTKSQNGTGLGLAIVKRIVLEHKGNISVGKSDLGGAKFEVVLPKKQKNENINT